jgi:hypothetical protein
MKIAFVNPPHANWCLTNVVTWLYISSYYDRYGKYADQIEWVEPLYQWDTYRTIDEIVDKLLGNDIIMFSSYVWNYDICDQLASKIKERTPATITVLGGPHVGQYEPDFFAGRTYYDYICMPTKPGEVFMQDLIDSCIETNNRPNIDDIAWEIRSFKKKDCPMPRYSIYADRFDYLKTICDYAKDKQLEPFIVLETTRGCPYSCVFCEWGGGIGGKIIKKEIAVVKQDIDMLVSAGFLSAFLSDANFGIFEERDIEIFKYAFEKGLLLGDISSVKSKDLKRRKRLVDAWFDIVGPKCKDSPLTDNSTYLEIANISSVMPMVSFQSISNTAMKVAKRVDLSYLDKLDLSKHIRIRCREYGFPEPALELILGMPGSTLDDFYNEFELMWNIKSWGNFRHDYMIMPDSELANPAYLKKFDIQSVKVYTDLIDDKDIENISGSEIWSPSKRNYFRTISSCYSFTRQDMCQMSFMNIAGNFLLEHIYEVFEDRVTPTQFAKVCYSIIKELDGFAKLYAELEKIYDHTSEPMNIKRLNGILRVEAIYSFLERNKTLLISEVFVQLEYGINN